MNELKERIPNETALRQVVLGVGPELVAAVRAEVGGIEAEYIKHRRRQRIGAGLIVVAFIIIQILDVDLDHSWGGLQALVDVITNIILILILPILAVLLYFGYKLVKSGREVVARFHQGVNGVLFTRALNLLGLTGVVLDHSVVDTHRGSTSRRTGVADVTSLVSTSTHHGSLETAQVLALLAHSELVTEAYNQTVVDNMLHVTHGSSTLFIAELDIKNVTGSGKNRKVKNIFRGYFVSFDLTRTLEAKTFVSTGGDEKGFGHQSFWGNRAGNALRETTLEWNEFENLLHVATTNEVEARYVLTTNFMHDLYEWWKDKKVNIRLSFIGNRLYILFPDAAIRFHDTVPKIEEKALTDYLFTITKPLMHVVHLVEDVKL